MKTDNELIAEFMGLTQIGIDERTGEKIWGNVPGPIGHCIGLDFDTNWNWLMPVVNKCKGVSLTARIVEEYDRYTCEIDYHLTGGNTGSVTEITAVHKAVVEAIKFINESVTSTKQQ